MYASKWEESYARYLDALVASGEILRWHYEPVKFILAPRTTYTPDFLLVYPDNLIEFVEVKGFRREDALVKYKVAASLHPEFAWRMVEYKAGEWKDIVAFYFPRSSVAQAVRVESSSPKTTKTQARPSRIMSYDQMLQDAELSPILKMKGPDFRSIRSRLSLSSVDMAERIGMTLGQYQNLEAGRTSLYHYRHVLEIKKLRSSNE